MSVEKDKNFTNLNSRYKTYLEEIEKILASFDVRKEYSFDEINQKYKIISQINTKNLIVEKDIELLFNNYEKTNQTISKLKSLLKKRNKYIISNLLRSSLYRQYIEKLHKDLKKPLSKIEPIILEIIKKYSMSWKCCWSILSTTDEGNITNFEIFDLNDLSYIKEKLSI